MNHFDPESLIDLGTQVADIDIHHIGLPRVIIAADLIQKCVPGQDDILVLQLPVCFKAYRKLT
jgi:hypothetical protein